MYLIISNYQYYPSAGLQDVVGVYTSIDEAREKFEDVDGDFVYLYEVGEGGVYNIDIKHSVL